MKVECKTGSLKNVTYLDLNEKINLSEVIALRVFKRVIFLKIRYKQKETGAK